ncbi:MAG: hypothetical protein ACYTG6_17230, partial [Planctomycetota bacterium]
MRRLRRILKRLAIFAVILGILGLIGFTWFAFWPLEGSIDRIEALVPEDVDFVYKTSWKELKGTRWIEENVQEAPFLPMLRSQVRELDRQLDQMAAEEDRINASIPLGLATFSFEDDVAAGEIIAAGRFCRQSGPERGPPRWREILLLTRIGWKTKFFSALKHGFVRSRVGPGLTVEDIGEGIYKFTLANVRVSPERDRRIC